MADDKYPSKGTFYYFKPKLRFIDMLTCFQYLAIFTLVLHISSVDCTDVLCIDLECDQGSCINNTCVCFPGWRGDKCNECHRRITLNSGKEGIIHDGSGNYSEDMTCSWLLDTGEKGKRVTIKVNSLATECIWDHVYIHNGDSAYAPLMAAYSGFLWGRKWSPYLRFKLTGQYAFIHFYSDAAFTLPGFNISYMVDDCPLGCSENGICNNTECQCKSGWSGKNCDIALNGCPFNCSGRGECVKDDLRGYVCKGKRDSIQVEKLPSPSFESSGRASLALVAEQNVSLWVMGGYRMGFNSEDNNLFRFDLSTQTWIQPSKRQLNPWPRYGHSGVAYENNLYVYGGVSYTEVKSDFWMYHTEANVWDQLESGPRNLSGHTAHVFDKKIIIIFGFSPDFGYSSDVLEYEFESRKWSVVKTTGSLVDGGYGHSSVFDESTQKIYVYGGHHNNGGNYKLTDKLYQYDPANRAWFILRRSGKARYLHSAVMLNGLMFVYGGNTHNDTRLGRHAKCFASDFMAYDRSCDRWYIVPSPVTDPRVIDLDRFGQAMVAVGNVGYLFGGFNAVIKNDLVKISPGDCSFHESRDVCESAFPGKKCLWNGTNCLAAEMSTNCQGQADANILCDGYNNCGACQESVSCRWCPGKCVDKSLTTINNCTQEAPNCSIDAYAECGLIHSCSPCQDQEQCIWQDGLCKRLAFKGGKKAGCERSSCKDKDSCSSCMDSKCMWCSSLNQCIDINAYVVYYFYGQCMDWTTKGHMCEANACSMQKTCEDCQSRSQCGWCDDGSGTGTGFCHKGGMEGPMSKKNGVFQRDHQICKAPQWFFNDCPVCQCSGHSQCVNGTDKCESCQSHTKGDQCHICDDGYFGNPLNGGNCSVCSCNGRADNCNPVTGDCYCRTKGFIGKNCEKCDEGYKYLGDHNAGGICYYTLTTDYQYTFNLSKKEDMNYSQINFLNTPTSSDRDVDFTLNCSRTAFLNITYRSRSYPEETEYISAAKCDYFRKKFEHKDFAFGGKENTTLLVYVYGFETPLKLQISFVQQDKLNLVKFFVIFFSCFLSLLLIAAALWKIKHKYDSYRRRQQHNLEMEEMASRPFSTISVEIERKSQPTVIDKRDHLDSVLRRRKRVVGNKPSAIGIEPLIDNKAAILTLIIQLPTGNSDFAPSGQSGLAMGSALVSIGSHRKQSVDHAKDKPKARKHLNIPLDTCA